MNKEIVVTEDFLIETNNAFKSLIGRLAILEIKDSSRIGYLKCIINNIDRGLSLKEIKVMIGKEIDNLTICEQYNKKIKGE